MHAGRRVVGEAFITLAILFLSRRVDLGAVKTDAAAAAGSRLRIVSPAGFREYDRWLVCHQVFSLTAANSRIRSQVDALGSAYPQAASQYGHEYR